VDGGYGYYWVGTSNLLVNPNPDVYTVTVQSYPGATSYILQVHLQIIGPTPLAFDGPGNSANVANQPAALWQYFQVQVPSDPNLLGWDLRLTNVTAGSPTMVVCRDVLPVTLGNGPWDNGSTPPWAYTNWPSGYQWQAGLDWTEDNHNADGSLATIGTLAMGVGNPLEAGTYYIGVYDPVNTSSYSVESRGIAVTNYSIPVAALAPAGSVNGTNLPAREAAYYQVVIPTNVPSWRLKLTPTAGDALLVVQQGMVPNVESGGSADSQADYGYPSGGFKAQKVGNEHYLLLPLNGQSVIPAGTYYAGVVSEGVNPNDAGGQIGTGNSSYALASLGPLPVVNLGTVGGTDLLVTNSLEGGDVAAYQFTLPPGLASLTNRVELTVFLTDLAGNAQYAMVEATNVPYPYPDYYGVDGGCNYDWAGTSNLLVNAAPDVYTLNVQSYASDAVYILQVHVQITGPAPLAFDGPGNSVSVTHQAPAQWRFFQVQVPSNTNLLGWDVRLTNVTAGHPYMAVCRDALPVTLGTGPWANNNTPPWGYTTWPSGYQWQAGLDWTGDSDNPDDTQADISTLAMGVGNPLEAGTYYIGVYDPSYTNSYTLESRGIAFTNYSIPVASLGFTASDSGTNLPPREAAYYQVVIPTNTPSWRLKLAPTVGDALLVVQQGVVPNIESGGSAVSQAETGAPSGGFKAQKTGHQHYLLLPPAGASVIPAGTYYAGVVSEGVNSYDASGVIGSNTTSYALSSLGPLPVANLGTVGGADLLVTNVSLESEDVTAAQFVVPSTLLGLEVRLENRVGNPVMTLLESNPGVPTPYPDNYGVEGGQSYDLSDFSLITIPNPTAGTYNVAVKATLSGGAYVDAGYDLRVREIIPSLLNISSQFNTNGGTNAISGTLADNGRAFYQVTVPATLGGAPVLGWQLNLSETNGTPTVRVRQNLLPDNTCDSTAFASGSIIVAPPYLTPGTWYVEVRGGGDTAFTLASSVITTNTMQRAPWTMPALGQADTTPGLSQPVFGDTGVDATGQPLPGDQGVQLLQGHYDFYAVLVPTNNAGLLHTELLAISGNPDLYLRVGAAPTVNHKADGNSACCPQCALLVDRELNSTTTQYGSWVPLSGRTDTQLTPGLWVIAVQASGNANVSYRLILSCGNSATNSLVQDLPLNGSLALTNQGVAGGDWRYYRVQLPTNAPNHLQFTWTSTVGSPHLFIRDTVPPGDGANVYDYNGAPSYAETWASDAKNEGPYPDFATPGTYTLTTPPLRPGTSYYFGIWSPDDAIFSITASTNSGTINLAGILDFYCGSFSGVIAGNGSLLYRLDVPPEATSLRLNAVNSSDLVLSLEQGTVALPGGPAQWTSYINQSSILGNQVNASLNQSLADPTDWPWLPGYSYYLEVTNTAASSESFSLMTDGRAAATLPVQLSGTYTGDGTFHLLVSGQSGSDYIIQSSTDLMNWISLFTNCAAFEFTDTNAVNYPCRFYRTMVAP
jgi:hypothetical protein